MSSVRVLIVADDPLVRSGLALLLEGQPGCEVVSAASSDSRLDGLDADVILWDLGWDPPESVAASGLPGAPPGVPLLALLPEGVEPAQVRAPAPASFLRRDLDAEPLAAALAAAAQGLVVLDPSFTSSLLPEAGDLTPPAEDLTARELEVLQLLAEGLPNKGIAHALGITEHTVKYHVNAILGKLGAQSRTEAVVRATRLGLILL